jgi:hypothetical protein
MKRDELGDTSQFLVVAEARSFTRAEGGDPLTPPAMER